ncbi:hypothetical protein [uncultured Microscilla sp.]|uniref:hypothetical protein n=1 Tax=uncultured Microscilla sp. TaxID=432653 RepID=UPI00260AEFBA|nr:hypothetical protein [uncultured Microscilla sp.]
MKKLSMLPVVLWAMLCLISCKKKETTTPVATNWAISTSDLAEANQANGEITKQNDGPLVKYQVATAYIQPISGNTHVFKLHFTSQDSLTCYVEKLTQDFNYHSDATSGQNKLTMVVFNQDTLQLKSSAISIQPRTDQNKFHTVSNLHSQSKGDYNGTVNEVPLIGQ